MSTQMPHYHHGQPVLRAGLPLEETSAAMIMIHGRGASARDIIGLSAELSHPKFTYLAPQAAGSVWYPYHFMEPIQSNEPYLSSALAVIRDLLDNVEKAGVPRNKTFLLGFSQGACLALEFAARNAARYGGVVGYSGGLIGPNGTPRDYAGSLDSTPIFLGCSDIDPHIPLERVKESAAVFTKLGGTVTERIYPNMDHTINADEIVAVLDMMAIAVPV
jgi:predicted esterase